jgi:predicted 3-demethylubiquinone-9 3-methyltransferase (glyoxalase superfamily)
MPDLSTRRPERVRPFLMFQGQAEAALRFYVETIPDSTITHLQHHPDGPAAGQLLRGEANIGGQPVIVFDSPVEHAFEFTPRWSFFVEANDEAEIETIYAALIDGGQALMPIGEYGFSRRFGWLNDRFGVSWQLNLA